MKKKLFYSFALFLFSSAFFVANSTTSKVADMITVSIDPGEGEREQINEWPQEMFDEIIDDY